MKIVMKVAMGLAVVLLVASIGLAIWQYGQDLWWDGNLAAVPDITPRQELYSTFFRSIQFPAATASVAAGKVFTLTWQRQPNLPADASFFFRVVDSQRGIFISETVLQPFQDADGASLVAPADAGNYELWVYVVTGGEEGLVAVAPVIVQ